MECDDGTACFAPIQRYPMRFYVGGLGCGGTRVTTTAHKCSDASGKQSDAACALEEGSAGDTKQPQHGRLPALPPGVVCTMVQEVTGREPFHRVDAMQRVTCSADAPRVLWARPEMADPAPLGISRHVSAGVPDHRPNRSARHPVGPTCTARQGQPVGTGGHAND